jgi:hypothetical protein
MVCQCDSAYGVTGYNYELPMSGLSARWLVPGRVSILIMYCIAL